MLALFILLTFTCSLSWAGTVITPSFYPGSGTYNIGEQVTLRCLVKTDNPPTLDFELNWYKRQDGDFLLLGDSVRTVKSPFMESDRFVVDWKADSVTNTINMTLVMTGLETVDIGEYRCSAGTALTGLTYSDTLQLQVTPSLSDEDFKLTVKAEEHDGAVALMNVPAKIKCSAESITRSTGLSLSIKLGDNTDITSSFAYDSSSEWIGEEGLKMPVVSFSLEGEWMPEQPGEGRISCYYQDGERQLGVSTSAYRRDATTSISCSSNNKNPVRYDDLDIYITCEVVDYHGSLSDLKGTWTFLYENEPIELTSGQKHSRVADHKDGKYTLFIPRITEEMLRYGKIFNYELELTRKDNGEVVATGNYGLQTDSTRRTSSDAASLVCSNMVILLTAITPFLHL